MVIVPDPVQVLNAPTKVSVATVCVLQLRLSAALSNRSVARSLRRGALRELTCQEGQIVSKASALMTPVRTSSVQTDRYVTR